MKDDISAGFKKYEPTLKEVEKKKCYKGIDAFYRQIELSKYDTSYPIIVVLGLDRLVLDYKTGKEVEVRKFHHNDIYLRSVDGDKFLKNFFSNTSDYTHFYYIPNVSKGSSETTGGTDKDIVKTRVLFAEFDDCSFEDQFRKFYNYKVRPNYYVKTKKSLHAYWVLNQDITDMSLWTYYQEQLIEELGSDKTIKNPARLMRMAGANYPHHGECTLIESDASELEHDIAEFNFSQKRPDPFLESSTKNKCYRNELSSPDYGKDAPMSDLVQQMADCIEDLYTWEGHNFVDAGNGKYKGDCPFHDSKSKTSFWVELNEDNVYSWACPTCTDNKKKNLLLYQNMLLGNNEQPKGQQLAEIEEQISLNVFGEEMMETSEVTTINFDLVAKKVVKEIENNDGYKFINNHSDFVEFLTDSYLVKEYGDKLYTFEFFNLVKKHFVKSNTSIKSMVELVDLEKDKESFEDSINNIIPDSNYLIGSSYFVMNSLVRYYINIVRSNNDLTSDPLSVVNLCVFIDVLLPIYYQELEKENNKHFLVKLGEKFLTDFVKDLKTESGKKTFFDKVDQQIKKEDAEVKIENVFSNRITDENIKLNPLFSGFIPDANTILLSSSPGVGKSLLVADLALAVIQPETKSFLDIKCKVDDGCVIYLNNDESVDTVVDRFKECGVNNDLVDMTTDNCRFYYYDDITDLPNQIYTIEDRIKKIKSKEKNLKLIIIDSLTSSTQDSGLDENRAEIARPMIKLTRIANAHNCAIVVLHHTNKDNITVSGSNRLSSACHVAYTIKRTTETQTGQINNDPLRTLICTKNRTGPTFSMDLAINPKHLWKMTGIYSLSNGQIDLRAQYIDCIQRTIISNLTREDIERRSEYVSVVDVLNNYSFCNESLVHTYINQMVSSNQLKYDPLLVKYEMVDQFRIDQILKAEKINGHTFDSHPIKGTGDTYLKGYQETLDLIESLEKPEPVSVEPEKALETPVAEEPTDTILELSDSSMDQILGASDELAPIEKVYREIESQQQVEDSTTSDYESLDDEKSVEFLNFLVDDKGSSITLREWTRRYESKLTFEQINIKYANNIRKSPEWIDICNKYDIYLEHHPDTLGTEVFRERTKKMLLEVLHQFNIDVIMREVRIKSESFLRYVSPLINEMIEENDIFEPYKDNNEEEIEHSDENDN